MLSPEAFIGEYKDYSYDDLLPVKDELINEIKELEKGDNKGYSGNTRYQMDLEYLGKLCELIADKFPDLQWKV